MFTDSSFPATTRFRLWGERGFDDDWLRLGRRDTGLVRLVLADAEQRRRARLAQAERVNGDDSEPDREREPLRLGSTGIEIARKPLSAPFGHDQYRTRTARHLVRAIVHRAGPASSPSP